MPIQHTKELHLARMLSYGSKQDCLESETSDCPNVTVVCTKIDKCAKDQWLLSEQLDCF